MKIQLQVVLGMMRSMAEGAARGDLVHGNVSPSDLKLVRGNIPWMGNQRTLVVNVIESYMFSALDCMGIMRFTVPAEYVCAAIAMFVHPTNIMTACVWMESGSPKLDALANPTTASVNRTPLDVNQLFSLVYGVLTESHSECKLYQKQFDSRCTVAYLKEIQGDIGHEETTPNQKEQRSGKSK